MTARRPPPPIAQPELALTLSADPSNDVGLDDILAGSRRVSPLAALAGPDGDVVAQREAHVARGRAAQRAGADFEAWLASQHDAMALASRDRVLAWWLHIEAPTRYVRDARTGTRVLRHVGVAAADYVMQTTRAWGSRVVVVEAKSVSGVSPRLSLEDLAQHQRDHLTAALREGGIALVAIELRVTRARGLTPTVHRYAVDWGEMPWRPVRKGSWSVGTEDLAGWEMPPETGPDRAWYLNRFVRGDR